MASLVIATDPPVSEAQRRAMWAAREGHSTLGIPESVGKKFVGPGRDDQPIALTRDLDLRDKIGVINWVEEELAEPEHAADSVPDAAGVMLMSDDGHVLLLKRGPGHDHPGEWAFPGGLVEEGESAEQAARREVEEEIGHKLTGELHLIDRRTFGGVDFATHFQRVAKQMKPRLNREHTDYRWVPLGEWPDALHGGVRKTLTMIHKGGPGALAIDSAFAFDKSARTMDTDGRMHVESSNISKSNICPYLGKEIPGFEELGLDAETIYKLFRDPAELAKGAASFNGLPILLKHTPVSADDHQPDLVVGTTGTDAEFRNPFLTNSLHVWAKDAIDGITSGKQRELSCGYRYKPDMTPGSVLGQPYDGVMREIEGNHVALVPEGRAGSDVVVGDSKEALMPAQPQPIAKIARILLTNYIEPRLAVDGTCQVTLPGLKGLTWENFAERKPKILETIKKQLTGKMANDASLEGIHTLLDSLDKPEAKDNEEALVPLAPVGPLDPAEDAPDELHGKLTEMLGGKCSPEEIDAVHKAVMEHHAGAGDAKGDEDSDEGEGSGDAAKDEPPPFPGKPEVGKGPPGKDKKFGKDKNMAKDAVTVDVMEARIAQRVKLAQDETAKKMRALNEAEKKVRPWVGELAMAFDSAEDVFKHALKTVRPDMKLENVHPSAYASMLELLPKPGDKIVTIANDAKQTTYTADNVADFNEAFPGAKNVKFA